MNTDLTSRAPSTCPECGFSDIKGQQIKTGDTAAEGGVEDWVYCPSCEFEAFYPLQQKVKP